MVLGARLYRTWFTPEEVMQENINKLEEAIS